MMVSEICKSFAAENLEQEFGSKTEICLIFLISTGQKALIRPNQ